MTTRQEPSQMARDAMDKATAAIGKIESHEDLCALRYATINDTMAQIKKLIGWGGGLLASLILGILAWSLSAQVEANHKSIEALQSRVVQVNQP